VVLFGVGVEIINYTIEIEARSAEGGRLSIIFAFVFDQIFKNAALRNFNFRLILRGASAIIEAISINIVRVDFINIYGISGVEVPASCRSWVY